MPSAAHESLVAMIKSAPAAPDMTIEQRRAQFAAQMASMPLAPEIETSNAELGGVPVEWVRVAGGDAKTIVLLVHGGGFVMGSAQTHREFASRIARAAGCQVVAVDYRLAPEASFPAPIDDVVSVYGALLDQGYSPRQISLLGDSCGGGLVLSLLALFKMRGIALPASAVAACPWIDLEVVGSSSSPGEVDDPLMSREMLQGIAGLYLGGASPKDPRANALFADLRGLPPILVQAGTRDILYSDAIRFAQKALAADVKLSLSIYEGLTHVWHLHGEAIPEGKEAVDEIALFLKRVHRD